MEVSVYTPLWFDVFLNTVDPVQTSLEVEFLARQLPLPEHRSVLDLCCGRGRHALPLAARGYQVTGIDRDAAVLAHARAAAQQGAAFVQADVLSALATPLTSRPADNSSHWFDRSWDGIICMWASFGYFSREENLALLAALRRCTRPKGRVILDIYNRDFFEERLGERRIVRGGIEVTEYKRLAGDRLSVDLHYDGHDVADHFSWQIFRPAELLDTVARAGFEPLLLCATFDENQAASAEHGRMQLVMQRPARA